jgi:hypothetical protein
MWYENLGHQRGVEKPYSIVERGSAATLSRYSAAINFIELGTYMLLKKMKNNVILAAKQVNKTF